MKTSRKILIGLSIFVITFLFKLSSIEAACNISVSAPSSVKVNQNFNVTVRISASPNLGNWEYVLSYDSSKVKLISGSLKNVGWSTDGVGKPSVSYSYTFKSLKAGTATFTPKNHLVSYINETDCPATVNSATVTMKTQAEIEAGYSKNNNLSSLSVEGAELSPAFNANTLEYTATLPVDTTKAKINATVADSTASVAGVGEIDVVDGLNRVEVVVTAQNGSKKTYVINLTVEELDPIKVKVDGKNYNIVRKSGQVEKIPVGFVEEKIKIEDQEVTAYKSEVTKLTLVALKDEAGNVKLFIYNAAKKEFLAFNEAKGVSSNLIILDKVEEEIPEDFEKTVFKYNNVSINGYKFKGIKNDNYYLVYAQNLETGNKGFYLYDKKDNTFQKYFSDLIDYKNEKIKLYGYVIIGVSALLLVFVIVFIIKVFAKIFTSKEKKIKKYQKKIDKLNKKKNSDFFEYEDEEEDTLEPLIKKVDEDDFAFPKKTRKDKVKELEEARERLNKNKPSYRRVSLEDDDEE